MAVLKFILDGVTRVVDTDIDHVIQDPESERYETASLIAHWGIIQASADEALERRKAELDNWYAKTVVACIEKDPKISEFKAKQRVEALDAYLQQCHAVASAKSLSDKISAVYKGFVKKHDILCSIVNRENSEYRNSSGDIGRDSKNDPRFAEFKANRRQRTE